MFAIFLFIVVFSFYCCIYNDMQRCNGTNIATSSGKNSQVNPAEPTQKKSAPPEAPPQPETVESAVQNSASEAKEQLPLSERHIDPVSKTRIAESLVLEQITNLKLREARIVAKLLSIAQKVNGKDKSLNWLQREIRQKLMSDRTIVIQALQQALVS